MRDLNAYISDRALGVDASGIRKVFDLAAKLKDPINLSIGLPDFDVPEIAKAAAIEAIQSGQNRYTVTQGIAPLREKLRAALSKEIGRDVGDVLITSGVSGGLLLAILSTINPGDEAIFLDPYFVMYKHLLTMAGGKSVAVDSYPDFRFHAERVERAITPRTKLLMLNSPNNPTGAVMSEQEIRDAVDIAKRHDLLLISDEIYEPFLYDVDRSKGGLYSPAALYEAHVDLAGVFQEPRDDRMEARLRRRPCGDSRADGQASAVHIRLRPSAFQFAAVKAMDVDMQGPRDAYRKKRDLVYSLLSKKFDVVKPGGAFYIFPKAPAGISPTDFCTRAIEKNVLIIPGSVFSEHDTHFRISYATTR